MDLRRVINGQRERRGFRVRNRMTGSATRPRLCVNRTLKNISVQIIDDEAGRTIASATTRDKGLREKIGYGGNCAAASILGKVIAERAIAAGVSEVCFDRGHCKYHGRVAALADAAREAGLKF